MNAAVTHDHLSYTLAFVCGLGLRKADSLRLNIRRQLTIVVSRRELLERRLLAKVVFMNSAGYLRICDDALDSERGYDPLDDTRIHPECYLSNDFASKICADALEVIHNSEQYIATVHHVMEDSSLEFEKLVKKDINWPDNYLEGIEVKELPDKLSELELEDYAKDLELTGKGKRLLQLLQIKEELRFPWLDRRKPLAGPTVEELFTYHTGETDLTLHVGLKVSCRVVEIREKSANLTVDGGFLRGFVRISNISNDRVENITDYLKVGDNKVGVILRVMKDQQRVEVSLKEDHVSRGEDWWISNYNVDEMMLEWWQQTGRGEMDPYFDMLAALKDYNDQMNKLKVNVTELDSASTDAQSMSVVTSTSQSSKVPINRLSFHPTFRNITCAEAEKELRGKGAGDVIIRPSSRGGLTITWAFQDSWFKHIEIIEVGRRPDDPRIGNNLMIKGIPDPFVSLDDILSSYIDPMNGFVTAMVNYRSFQAGSPEDVEKYLYKCKENMPARIPYCVRFDPQHPGYFVLTWLIPESTTSPIKKEVVAVTPEVSFIRMLLIIIFR